jgi:hypothetical protein
MVIPWSMGNWQIGSYLGTIRFDANTAQWYQNHIRIFPISIFIYKGTGRYFLNKQKQPIFFSGANQWKEWPQWPAGR